jgi:hypothetical protein
VFAFGGSRELAKAASAAGRIRSFSSSLAFSKLGREAHPHKVAKTSPGIIATLVRRNTCLPATRPHPPTEHYSREIFQTEGTNGVVTAMPFLISRKRDAQCPEILACWVCAQGAPD